MMKGKADIILGSQWGDEGKARVVDALCDDYYCVVRCQGGANAGHTVVVGGQSYVFHVLPSCLLRSKPIAIIGNGCVVDPYQFVNEIESLKRVGIEIDHRLLLSDRATLVLPSHKTLDHAEERHRSPSQKIGTTGRGIGPAYCDRTARMAIRFFQLHEENLREVVISTLKYHNRLLSSQGEQEIDVEQSYEELKPIFEEIRPYICDTSVVLNNALNEGKHALLEGAQGLGLDLEHGSYPYVTSSSVLPGAVITGTGISHKYIGSITGVIKGYATRVGQGPFPTEIHGEKSKILVEKGHEFGSTTGRPRRVGWFDAVHSKHYAELAGLDHLVLTKLDILGSFPEIFVCVDYKDENGGKVQSFPASPYRLASIDPVYETLEGWSMVDWGSVKSFRDLPSQAQRFVHCIEDHVGIPIRYISFGPQREEMIIR